MYYIYHIPGKKIGCTDNLDRRATEYKLGALEVLETHDCIYKASDRERELQAKYNYKVDSNPYWWVVQVQQPKANSPEAIAKKKITLSEIFNQEEYKENRSRNMKELYIQYPDLNKGKNHPMHGVKRIGEEGPNYGTRRGRLIIETSTGFIGTVTDHVIHFNLPNISSPLIYAKHGKVLTGRKNTTAHLKGLQFKFYEKRNN
jgi:sporulation protein YlmC with PRC-barrel domain